MLLHLKSKDLSVLLSASGSGTGGTLVTNTKITQFKWVNGVGTTQWGLFIDNTNAQGRLGIGTASNPTSALHIYNTTPHIRLEDADTSEYVRIKGDDGNMVLEVDLAESDADSYLGIDIDNGERARFTSSGLGIGTSSPSSSLHVAKANAALGFDAGLWISSNPSDYTAGRGGAGTPSQITASAVSYAGGGGGTSGPGAGGAASPCGTGGAKQSAGTTNRGGGGGSEAAGGSGIVIIRYKFQ